MTYACPICGKSLNERTIHEHFVTELSEKFQNEGYKIIREGKIPTKGWHEPDLFILRNLNLVKVIEVIVLDSYEGEGSVKEKGWKIRNYYSPPEIIVFEPTKYLDKVRLPKIKNNYKEIMGFEPKSYTEIQEFYAKKWKKDGLDIVFWNEENLRS